MRVEMATRGARYGHSNKGERTIALYSTSDDEPANYDGVFSTLFRSILIVIFTFSVGLYLSAYCSA